MRVRGARSADHRSAKRRLRAASVVVGLLLGGLFLEPASATTFIVDSTADTADADTADTVCLTSGGACTLRAAMQQAQANPGLDHINFDIPGPGVHTITPVQDSLPAITDPLKIDGYTQPGASVNTLAFGTNAVLKIRIHESDFPSSTSHGLVLRGASASGSTIQGLIIDSFSAAISLEAGASNNVISGNFIGTTPDGTAADGNGIGIVGDNIGDGNVIGGPTPAARNLISGNSGGVGVDIVAGNASTTADNNQVHGNLIGTNAAGTGALGNSTGVRLFLFGFASAADNSITGNVIAFNTQEGVEVNGLNATNNPILGNSIHSNGLLGIELVAGETLGVTPNDTNDTDTGPNDRQNFPIITAVSTTASSTTVGGTLNSTPSASFRLEFFANQACDSSGNGEGKTFLGSTDVTTDSGGNAGFSPILPTAVPGGQAITATATEMAGTTPKSTSEFSPCFTVPGTDGPVLTVTNTESADPVLEGDPLTYTLTVANTGNQDASNVFVRDDLPASLTFVSATGTGWNCDYDATSNDVLCFRPSLAATTTAPDITVSVTPQQGGTFTNAATVFSDQTSPVTVSEQTTATALFDLTVTVAGNGTVTGTGINCPTDCTETYSDGAIVRLTPFPTTGSEFLEWSFGCELIDDECELTMTSDQSITATFGAIVNNVSVNKQSDGFGTITGLGLDCGPDLGICDNDFPPGASVTLSASPSAGSTFDGWGGACTNTTGDCALTLSTEESTFYEVFATFTLIKQDLTVSKSGTGTGKVTGPGIDCGTDCTEAYGEGTIVTLTASPDIDASFDGWSGACTNTTGDCIVTISEDKSVTANFTFIDPCASPTITGTEAGETLVGTRGSDVIDGLGGNDTIDGGRGNDIICGRDGDDQLLGGGGDDSLFGGNGNDTLTGGGGGDALDGGPDTDSCEKGSRKDPAPTRCENLTGSS